jgi:hypothetical protein
MPAEAAAPPPPAAPSAPAATSGATPRPFTELAKAVLARAPTLSVLASGRPLHWDGDRLVIGFAKPFEVEQAKDKLPQIRRLLAEETGRELHIEVQQHAAPPGAAPDAESLAEAEERRRTDERAARRREALSHPARKQLMEVFGEEVSFLEPLLE